MDKPKYLNHIPCPICGHHLNPKLHPNNADILQAYCPLCDKEWEIPISIRETIADLLHYPVDVCEGQKCGECDLLLTEHYDNCIKNILGRTADILICNNVTIQKFGDWHADAKGYVCSSCNNWSYYNTPYCPECGAKMTNS